MPLNKIIFTHTLKNSLFLALIAEITKDYIFHEHPGLCLGASAQQTRIELKQKDLAYC